MIYKVIFFNRIANKAHQAKDKRVRVPALLSFWAGEFSGRVAWLLSLERVKQGMLYTI